MVDFTATLTESNSKLFDTRSRDGLSHLSKVEIGRHLHSRGREAIANVRSLYGQHRRTGNLQSRIGWKAPYQSIQESQFTRYNRDALYFAVGIYDRPGDTREKGARAYIARFLERGTKRRLTKKSSAYRGRIRPYRYLEKGAKLNREEVKLTRAITRAGRKAISLRRRRSYKVA